MEFLRVHDLCTTFATHMLLQQSHLFTGINTWPRLFKYWITLSTGKITIQQIYLELKCVIYYIKIYPVDSVLAHFEQLSPPNPSVSNYIFMTYGGTGIKGTYPLLASPFHLFLQSSVLQISPPMKADTMHDLSKSKVLATLVLV